MSILVAGASGATGRLLVEQLLARGLMVKAVVRSPSKLPDALRKHPNLSLIHAGILDLGDAELAAHVRGCSAVVSCLGHNLSWKGIYGAPRRLVTDATRRLCEAIRAGAPQAPVRFVLMNTAANGNRDLHEPVSFGHRCVIGLLRLLLPPHADNESAAEYLRSSIGQTDRAIEWAVVRPDTLVDLEAVTDYRLYQSPTRSAIFNAGSTARINVAHFMADLITDDDTWASWRGRMPVIYDEPAT